MKKTSRSNPGTNKDGGAKGDRAAVVPAVAHVAKDQRVYGADDFELTSGFEIQRYVVAELNEERARRVRIDATGSALITVSTALSALAFAATTLVTKAGSLQLPYLSLGALAVTFAAFMVAAVCGLCGGGRIHRNKTVDIDVLQQWRTTRWDGARSAEAQAHLDYLIRYLGQLRTFNQSRARWVIGGSFSQIVAITALSLAVVAILVNAMYPEWSLNGLLDTPARVRARS